MKIIFFILIFINSLFAFDSVEILNPNITIHKSGYLKSNQQLTEKDVYQKFINGEFSNFSKDAKSFGFSVDEYWFAFDITITNSNTDFFMDIKDPLAELCVVYIFQENKLIHTETSGYMTLIKNRPVPQFHISFKLIDSNLKTTYLIKTVSQYPFYASYSFGKQHELETSWHLNHIIFILSCGIFFAIFFYNIFLYFIIKDKSYIFYCIYIFGFFMITLVAQGYVALFLPTMLSFTPIFVALFLQIEFIGIVFFTIYFLNLTKTFPKIEKYIRYLLYANIIASLTVPFIPILQILSMFFMNTLYLILIYVGFRSYFNGFKPALYYLIATGVALISIFAYSFMNQGVFFSFNIWSFNLMTFGLVWDMILLSFALAYRIKLLQEEKLKTEIMLTMASRHSAIGEFAGNVAHQWRQPLSILGSMVTNIDANIRFIGEVKLNELKEFVSKSNNIISHMSSTIDIFQEFFAHKENISTNSFDIREQIQRCIDFTNNSMKDYDIKVKFIANHNLTLIGDENEFAQIILNLISNAKDVLIKHRKIDREIIIILDKKDKYITITIQDNGGGIKIEPLDKIFEPYISTKNLTGTGIGLFIVKNIIEQRFKGSIQVENIKFGAMFVIKFYYS